MDRALYRLINGLADHTTWAHGAFKLYANAGIVVFAALLIAAYLDGRRHNAHLGVAGAIWAGGAALAALGAGQLIGRAVDRLRPYETMTDVHVLIARTADFSFPSDHATVAGAVAAGLLMTNRRWGTVAAVAAGTMAFTRVYVGAHYPADVLAGLTLGAVVAVAGRLFIVPVIRQFVTHLARTRLRPVVAATLASKPST